MLIDSHCHLNCLDLARHGGDLNKAIQAAHQAGVTHMLCVCIDMENFPQVLAIAKQYPNVYASVGLHPNETSGHDPHEDEIVAHAQHPKVIAIGETGLDYYRSQGDVEWQRERFRRHICAAKKSDRALIVHTRDASDDTINILREENAGEVGGVMHCFTGTYEIAKQALDFGFYISFSGIVTFKNAIELQEVAKKIPLDRMLVETDSPYLAPVPYRGKPNEPAYVRYVAECIAQLRGITYEQVAEQTSENFFRLFKYAVSKYI